MKRFLGVLLLCSFVTPLLALVPGDKASEFEAAKWVKGGSVAIRGVADKKPAAERSVFVVVFWATWSPASPMTLRYLARLGQSFASANVKIVAVSKEEPKKVEAFVASDPAIVFHVGADEQDRTFKSYMGKDTGVPVAFVVGRDQVVAWKGDPVELNRVLANVVAGTYDEGKQLKIERLREEMKTAAQYMDMAKEAAEARKVLEVDPTDRIALDAVVAGCLREGRSLDALPFLDAAVAAADKNRLLLVSVCYGKLDYLSQDVTKDGRARMVAFAAWLAGRFASDPESLEFFASRTLDECPAELWSAGRLLAMATAAMEQARRGKDAALRGRCAATLAKARAAAGDLAGAVAAQEEAVGLAAASDAPRLAARLEFYRDALACSKAGK